MNISKNYSWLITGVAGFIGSNLLEFLLKNDQLVVGLDNFATGHQKNLDEVLASLSAKQKNNFLFIEGDIRNLNDVNRCFNHEIDFALHQAALGSVPRSIKTPLETNSVNVDGFLNVLKTSVDNKVKKFVYASSSSVYGDSPHLPKQEDVIGMPLSPYAVSKRTNELYANAFSRCYDIQTIGLRYFNVFGPRQDPNGPYAAVIPLWIDSLLKNKPVYINGDGETSRDFCYIENVVQANIKSALSTNPEAANQVYNVACGERTTLNELFVLLRENLKKTDATPTYREFREGDVRHSHASITKIIEKINYSSSVKIQDGLKIYTTEFL
ncbi:MAG: LPS biosynthesis protein WbpP [Rickettsiales bacterium]|nr:LPS biosynthesis protein WbpP [Rickettsiales bacterium]|tara:strand:- start:7608 stop:8585 length:978 start_codon:yes stop_codon:yes gene_type:complete